MRGVSALAPTLAPHILVFVAVVSILAELFTDKPKEEKPEEIGMKAEQADKKPEDFDSVSDYLEYLRNEVKLDPAKVEKLTPEERQKYQLVGLGLYIKDIEEKSGLKLDPDFVKAIPNLKNQGYEAADIANLMQSMKKNGVTDMKQYVDFMKGDLQPGSPERQQVGASVKDMVEQHFKGADVNMRKEINKLADTVRE
ncbi:hypothetical protein [Phascolarctobacterium succinatutens]|uniref:Uncharacterized protein n=1 Tax=Phascolarctobacterium succinatutens TaxID=626940 RepID=A0A1Q6R3U3_9FIRM|nr:hypothetical protein [Phascolarctobacterium succinatutens]MDD7141048.1 hypothetical protein [Phascolarctobacterium succinatutens]OLA37044.1 MAG: hypothetical protein BHW43_07670 [Phascolarctobacterium succinatutens]